MACVSFSLIIESVPVDAIPPFVQLAADTPSARKEIDSLYGRDSARYFLAASKSPYYHHNLFTNGGIEREIYARKFLGLVLAAIEDGPESQLFAQVFAVLSKRWADLDRYIEDCEEVILEEVIGPRFQSNSAARQTVSNLLSGVISHYLKSFVAVYPALDMPYQAALKFALFAACARGRTIKAKTPELLKEIKALSSRTSADEGFRSINRKLTAPEFKKLAKEFKNAVYHKVHPAPFNPWQEDKFIEGWAHCGAYLSATEGLSLIRQEFTAPPKDRDVELLCRLYFIKATVEWLRFDRVSQTKEEVEADCAEFVMFGLVILQLIREYKKARHYYFVNNADQIRGEMAVLQERAASAEEKLRKANDDAAAKAYLLEMKEKRIRDQERQHRQEIESLTMEIERLKANAARSAKFEAEEAALTRASQGDRVTSSPALVAPDTQSDLEKLKNVRAVVIGGTERWQARLSSCLPHFVYLHGDAGFDESLIINTEIVFADIRFKFDHCRYYRLMDIVRRHKKRLVFLSKTNTALTIHQMSVALDGQVSSVPQTSIV